MQIKLMTPIETPCRKVCKINKKTELCEGCFRTIEEIARWATYSTTQRRQIMLTLPFRDSNRTKTILENK